jgi:hypothetical protein
MVGMPTRNENSVAETRLAPRIIASMIVEPEREEPGKAAAISCPIATAMTTGHEMKSDRRWPPGDGFHHDEDDAADNERDGDRLNGLGKLKSSFFKTSPPMQVITNATKSSG